MVSGIKLLDSKNYFHALKMILICIYHCAMLACIGTQMNAYLLQGNWMLKTAITVPICLLVLLPSAANLSFKVFPPLLMASLSHRLFAKGIPVPP